MKKNFLSYAFTFSFLSLLISCEKTDRSLNGDSSNSSGQYTISGRFYQSCSRQPLANAKLVFWQSSIGGRVLGETTTDASGNFKFNYDPANSNWIDYGVANQVGYSSYGKIVPYRNYSSIELFKVPTTYLKVSMRVYNSYTNKDTFYIVDYRKATPPWTISIPGPFVAQSLYDIPNYNLLNYAYGDTQMAWGFKINNGDYVHKTDTLRVCDTTRLIAEVR